MTLLAVVGAVYLVGFSSAAWFVGQMIRDGFADLKTEKLFIAAAVVVWPVTLAAVGHAELKMRRLRRQRSPASQPEGKES